MKEQIIIPMDNEYVSSVMKSFRQFLIAKITDRSNACLQFQESLQAAELLHGDTLKQLRNGNIYFGRWDSDNTELILEAK